MLDNEVVPAHIMGLESGNNTKGLRSNKDSLLEISHANKYQSFMLNKAKTVSALPISLLCITLIPHLMHELTTILVYPVNAYESD